MTMSSEVLLIEKKDGVATLTLNRPEAMNALSRSLSDALSSAFREIQSDPDIRVAVVTGNGKAFCAGMDLKELGSGGDESRGTKIGNPTDAAMRDFEGPIIAAVNGFAVTAGFELAQPCVGVPPPPPLQSPPPGTVPPESGTLASATPRS